LAKLYIKKQNFAYFGLRYISTR